MSVIGQDQKPNGSQHRETEHDGRRPDVLGHAGERVALRAAAIHGRLDRTVQYFDNQNLQHRTDQERPFDAGMAQEQAAGNDQCRHAQRLTKSGLFPPSVAETFDIE
jgi:hypothetical protein